MRGIIEETFNYKPINKIVTGTQATTRSSGDQLTSFAVSKGLREKTTKKERYRSNDDIQQAPVK